MAINAEFQAKKRPRQVGLFHYNNPIVTYIQTVKMSLKMSPRNPIESKIIKGYQGLSKVIRVTLMCGLKDR